MRIPEYQPRTTTPDPSRASMPRARPADAIDPFNLAPLQSAINNSAALLDRSQEEQARAWSADAISKARLEWTQELINRQEKAEAGAPEFAPSYLKDFDAYADKVLQGAPTEKARTFLTARLTDIRNDLGERALTFEAKARVDYRTDKFTEGIDNVAKLMNTDPGQFKIGLAEQLAIIESADIPPVQKSALRQKAVEKVANAAVWSQIQKSPTAFLASIGFGKPRIKNADGSFSTEKTITIEVDGKHIVIPTIVDGKQRDDDQAVAMWKEGRNAAVGEFKTAGEADKFAQERSDMLGKTRQSSGDLKGMTGNAAFDALPFERRVTMLDHAIRLKAQIDSDAERLGRAERERLSNEAMKQIWNLHADKKLTRAFIEERRQLLSASDYHSALKALEAPEGGTRTDSRTFNDILRMISNNDFIGAEQAALSAHRNGMLSEQHVQSIVTQARTQARQEGPKTQFERSMRYIGDGLDPGPFVQDPVGKSRAAEARDEFEQWVLKNKPDDEKMDRYAKELVTRYKFNSLSDTLLGLPAPRSGMIRRNVQDMEGVKTDIAAAMKEADRRLAAKEYTEAEYNQDVARIGRWIRAINKGR